MASLSFLKNISAYQKVWSEILNIYPPGPNIFTSRAGSYVWGESLDGVRGIPDKDFKAPFIPQLGWNHGFINGVFDERQ